MRGNSTERNKTIREALKKNSMFQWELAELMGVTEATITRWMRKELPEETQREMVELIEKGTTTEIPPTKSEE